MAGSGHSAPAPTTGHTSHIGATKKGGLTKSLLVSYAGNAPRAGLVSSASIGIRNQLAPQPAHVAGRQGPYRFLHPRVTRDLRIH